MGSDWKELTIDELKSPIKSAIAMGPFGSRIKAENFVDSGVPILKGGNLHKTFITEDKFDYLTEEKAEELKTSQAIRRDLVITHRGTIGQVSIIPDNSNYQKYIVSQSQLKVTLNQDLVNPYFVNYFFRSNLGQHRLLANSSQVGVPAIAKASSSVKEILVPCPTLQEQNKVVDILSSLDNKIELNNQTNQTLEQIAQAMFKSWFVDFDPVIDNALAAGNPIPDEFQARAELRQRVIAERATNPKLKPLPDDIQQLFPNEFEESELGWIPKGWSAGVMSDHAEIEMGNSPKGDTYNISGIGTPLVNGPVEFGSYFTKRAKWTTAPTKLSRKNDLIVCVRGSTTGRYVKSDGIFCIGRGVCSVTGKQSQVFTEQLFKQSIRHMLGLTTGSTFPNWSRQTLSNFTVINPEKPIVQLFDDIVQPIINKVEQGTLECETLEVMRDALLPKLISGELII
jgi:type I restriction enzyme S subunit